MRKKGHRHDTCRGRCAPSCDEWHRLRKADGKLNELVGAV